MEGVQSGGMEALHVGQSDRLPGIVRGGEKDLRLHNCSAHALRCHSEHTVLPLCADPDGPRHVEAQGLSLTVRVHRRHKV